MWGSGWAGSVPRGQGPLPGLQDLKGRWSGSIQAYGGGGGATNCEFDVKGEAWQWGDYGMDQVIASGVYHSVEGIKLEEFCLKAGLRLLASCLGPPACLHMVEQGVRDCGTSLSCLP